MIEGFSSPAPRLRHHNQKMKPDNVDDVMKLVDKVCDKMHVNANACKLLKYYAGLNNGWTIRENVTKEATGLYNLSPIHAELVEYGLIAHIPYKAIIIDWERITILARYLVESKCEKNRRQILVAPVDEAKSIRTGKQLEKRGLCINEKSNIHWLTSKIADDIDNIMDCMERL